MSFFSLFKKKTAKTCDHKRVKFNPKKKIKCDNCKKQIINDKVHGCIKCYYGICSTCNFNKKQLILQETINKEPIFFMDIHDKAKYLIKGYIREYIDNEKNITKKEIHKISNKNNKQNMTIYISFLFHKIPENISDLIVNYIDFYYFNSRILKTNFTKNLFYNTISKKIYHDSNKKRYIFLCVIKIQNCDRNF